MYNLVTELVLRVLLEEVICSFWKAFSRNSIAFLGKNMDFFTWTYQFKRKNRSATALLVTFPIKGRPEINVVSVSVAPQIKLPNRLLNASVFTRNDRIHFKIPVIGCPRPEITWSRNGNRIVTQGKLQLSRMIVFSLKFPEVDMERGVPLSNFLTFSARIYQTLLPRPWKTMHYSCRYLGRSWRKMADLGSNNHGASLIIWKQTYNKKPSRITNISISWLITIVQLLWW